MVNAEFLKIWYMFIHLENWKEVASLPGSAGFQFFEMLNVLHVEIIGDTNKKQVDPVTILLVNIAITEVVIVFCATVFSRCAFHFKCFFLIRGEFISFSTFSNWPHWIPCAKTILWHFALQFRSQDSCSSRWPLPIFIDFLLFWLCHGKYLVYYLLSWLNFHTGHVVSKEGTSSINQFLKRCTDFVVGY